MSFDLLREPDRVRVVGGYATQEQADVAKDRWEKMIPGQTVLVWDNIRKEYPMALKKKDKKADVKAPEKAPEPVEETPEATGQGESPAPAEEPKEKKKRTKKEPSEPKAERGPSYQDKIKKFLDENGGVGTKAELMEATGADSKNLSVSVSILRNGERIKEPRKVLYLRANETYYDLDNKDGREAFEAAQSVAKDAQAQAKKEARKAKKAKKEAPAEEATQE